MDYLREAKILIGQAQQPGDDAEGDRLDTLLAIACAGVAQAELLAALIQRLDRIIDSEDNTLYVTLTK